MAKGLITQWEIFKKTRGLWLMTLDRKANFAALTVVYSRTPKDTWSLSFFHFVSARRHLHLRARVVSCSQGWREDLAFSPDISDRVPEHVELKRSAGPLTGSSTLRSASQRTEFGKVEAKWISYKWKNTEVSKFKDGHMLGLSKNTVSIHTVLSHYCVSVKHADTVLITWVSFIG